MLTILWKEGEAEGYTDLIPPKWFRKEGASRGLDHQVLGPLNGEGKARCDVTTSLLHADLDYGGIHEKFNVRHRIIIGIVRLKFDSPARNKITEVLWKKGDKDFKKCNVELGTSRHRRSKVAASRKRRTASGSKRNGTKTTPAHPITLGDIIATDQEQWQKILNSLMPGGENWDSYIEGDGGGCLETCPSYINCKRTLPVCTTEWQTQPATSTNLRVMIHVLKNYRHYNRRDLPRSAQGEARNLQMYLEECDSHDDEGARHEGKSAFALRETRLNQSIFRKQLEDVWGSRCAVTGAMTRAILRASHIKPWSESDTREQLNKDNGLLLAAHIDAAFDAGLISFEDNGSIVFSKAFPANERATLKINDKMGLSKQPTPGQKKYLKWHRKHRLLSC